MKLFISVVSLLIALAPLVAQKNAHSGAFSDNDMVLLAASPAESSFVIGSGSQSYTARRTLTPFYLNRYETTYRFWYRVRITAEKNGYVFKNPGQEGSAGRRARLPSEKGEFEPVTMISWYDAVVWCNALSEQEGRLPCYTYEGQVIRDSSDTAILDICQCNWDADGYRLPSETEWEYAARRTKAGFQNGDLASGQINDDGTDDDSRPETEIAWFDSNTRNTREVGTAGTVFTPDAPPAPGSGAANGAGIFDMSGNVLEFCWDWFADYTDQNPGIRAVGPEFGAERVSRGGSWSPYTEFIAAGDRYSFDPNETYNYMGFRICSNRGN